MAKDKDEIQLDPEKFAYSVVNAYCPNEADDLKASKKVLKRYLSAYFLAQEFNHMETRQFEANSGLDYSLLAHALDSITSSRQL